MVILYYGNGERSGVGHMEILWNDANISPPPPGSLYIVMGVLEVTV